MNIVELLTVVVIFYCGYSLAQVLGGRYGPVGQIAGFIAGCLFAIAAYALFRYWLAQRDRLPPCTCGRSGSMFREWKFVDLRLAGGFYGVCLRCSCGKTYLLTRPRFLEVLEDGNARAYMIQRGYRFCTYPKWEPDEDAE